MKSKFELIKSEWQSEDAFFGALLGAVFGIVANKQPGALFLLLIFILGLIVVYLKEASLATTQKRKWILIINAFVVTLVGSLFLLVIDYFKFYHCLWFIGIVVIWTLLKETT